MVAFGIGLSEKQKENEMDIRVGDRLKMKKAHPCGSSEWEVLRIGADFRLRCCGCGHEVMGARSKFERNVKAVLCDDAADA